MTFSCFVISPIGAEGSDVRQNADDFYDLIVESALKKYNFEVTRADKLTTSGTITSEVIKLIQESDLCIVDVTGLNPNVMYECGRRHETAKPYIMMAREDQLLPFDINVIRTIFYKLDTPRAVNKAVLTLQTMVDKMVDAGFTATSGGDSLSSVMEILNRIERKIGTLQSNASLTGTVSVFSDTNDDPVTSGRLSVFEAFSLAIAQRNLSYAEALLPRIKVSVNEETYFEYYIEPLAGNGSRVAGEMLVERIDSIMTLPNDERRVEMLAYLASYFIRHDEEVRGIELLVPIIDKIIESTEISNAHKASLINQKQRLLYGWSKDNAAECVSLLKSAIELNPNETSFYYNLAYVFVGIEKFEDALEPINNCLRLNEQNERADDDHILLAIKINKRLNNREEFNRLSQLFRAKWPERFELLRIRGEI